MENEIKKKRVASPTSRFNQAEQKTNFARDKTRNFLCAKKRSPILMISERFLMAFTGIIAHPYD